jgi:hypothetical protein
MQYNSIEVKKKWNKSTKKSQKCIAKRKNTLTQKNK